jgi:NAD(P)H-flavin reductase
MNTLTGRLTQKKQISEKIFFLQYTFDHEIEFRPGQFLTLDLKTATRSYSIASSPLNKRKIDFIVKFEDGGIASNFFSKTQVNDPADFIGPGGLFTLKESKNPKIFLATGVGFAPIRSMIHTLAEKNFPGQYILFWGLSYSKDLYFEQELKRLKKEHNNFNFIFCISREEINKEYYKKGHVQEILQQYLEKNKIDAQNFEFYVCGAPQNVQFIIHFLETALHIPEGNIFSEKFIKTPK